MNATRNFAKVALCSALALGAVGTVSSVFADEMPAKSDQPVTDTWITTKVKSELATTDGVKSTKISVTTKDGIVALVGVLATKDSVDKAIAATESVKGVKKVDSSGLKVKYAVRKSGARPASAVCRTSGRRSRGGIAFPLLFF